MRKISLFIMALSVFGCVKVPTIVMVDRKTALEEQVAMAFPQQADSMVKKAISPRPVPYTRGKLEAAGINPAGSTFDVVLRPYKSYVTDQEQLDGLLRRRCVGESLDGMVQETPETCTGHYDQAVVSGLLQRVNQHRRQVLAFLMKGQRSPDAVKSAFHKRLLQVLVCGGQFQDDAGKWEVKRCE